MSTPRAFNQRTVNLLVSIDPYQSHPDDGDYVTRDFKLLGRSAVRRIRSASPADIAQAKLICAAERDTALARYVDKLYLYKLLYPHAQAPYEEALAEILARMPAGDRAEAEAALARVRSGPGAGVPSGEDAVIAELARLYRIEYIASEFASTTVSPGGAAEAELLAGLCQLRRAVLGGGPEWGAAIAATADEAAAALDDLNERYPAEPAA